MEDFLKKLAVIIANDIELKVKSQVDPVEIYAERLKGRTHAHDEAFYTRFAHGYTVLIKELKQMK